MGSHSRNSVLLLQLREVKWLHFGLVVWNADQKMAHCYWVGNTRLALLWCRGRDSEAQGGGNVRMDLSFKIYPHLESPIDKPSSSIVIIKFARGSLSSLKSSGISVSHSPCFTVVTRVTLLICWRQGGHS